MKATYYSLMHSRLCAGVSIVLMLSACGKAPEPEIDPPVRPVKMMTIGAGPDKVSWEYPGEISATRNVHLGFEVSGKIIELPIQDGMEVKEGGMLGRLDPVDYQAARDAATANRRAMRSAYVRAKNIFDQGAGSQAEVDKTRRDIKVAEQDLKKAQKALDDTTLLAPYDGVVGQKLGDDFQNVQAKEPILIFQDTSSLEMDVSVPERDFVRMKQGLTLQERTERARPEIRVSSIPDQRFPARIKSFTATADPVTRTYKATFAFDNPADINILPGMTARVILTAQGEALEEGHLSGGIRIPAVATAADEQGNAYVWRVDPDSMKVTRVSVTLGEMYGMEIQVKKGLQKGDRIAISGVAHLHEGMQVRQLKH